MAGESAKMLKPTKSACCTDSERTHSLNGQKRKLTSSFIDDFLKSFYFMISGIGIYTFNAYPAD